MRQVMKPAAWIAGGLALMGLAAVLGGVTDHAAAPAARATLYVPAFLALAGGQYFLWRGMKSGIAMLWSGAFDRRSAMQRSTSVSAGDEDGGSGEGFDADAVFARYLERQEAYAPESPEEPPSPAPVSTPQPVRPTFGRRIV
jgi:hypothetical protein